MTKRDCIVIPICMISSFSTGQSENVGRNNLQSASLPKSNLNTSPLLYDRIGKTEYLDFFFHHHRLFGELVGFKFFIVNSTADEWTRAFRSFKPASAKLARTFLWFIKINLNICDNRDLIELVRKQRERQTQVAISGPAVGRYFCCRPSISIFTFWFSIFLATKNRSNIYKKSPKAMTIPTTGLQNIAMCSVFTLFFGKFQISDLVWSQKFCHRHSHKLFSEASNGKYKCRSCVSW